MDPKDKKIAELEAEIANLNGVIAQKNQDIVGIRKKYKLLSEMTDEEKEKLTAEELADREAQDEIVLATERAAQEAADLRTREVKERRDNLFSKLITDPELRKKAEENFALIKGSDLAYTEGEISSFVEKAVNMLGNERPNPVNNAINGQGGVAPGTEVNEGQFAGSDKGKNVASNLGLSFVNEANGGQGGGEGGA